MSCQKTWIKVLDSYGFLLLYMYGLVKWIFNRGTQVSLKISQFIDEQIYGFKHEVEQMITEF